MIKHIPTEELEEYQVGNLRVMRGGKGPPMNTGGVNWLNGLNKGTAFSCKKKGNVDALDIFIIAFKYDRTVILVNGMDNNQRFAVDPEDFCKKYSYWETIGEEDDKSSVKEEERKALEGDDNGSKGTLRSGVVEDDADVEGRQPTDEEA